MSRWIIFYITLLNWEMVGPQILCKLLLKHTSCCTPRFPLILTAQLHSLYVKQKQWEILERVRLKILERSGVGNGNFGKVGVGYLPPTLQPWFTLMVKPVHACHLFYISFQFNLQFGTYSVDNAI